MTKINNLKIFVAGSLLLVLLVAIFIKVNIDEKPKYNTCDGENIAEWEYATGAVEYDICVDKDNKALFIDRDKALEYVKNERKDALDYIRNVEKLDELSENNYKQYYEYTNNVEDGSEYYSDLIFLNEFFKVYDNNFVK